MASKARSHAEGSLPWTVRVLAGITVAFFALPLLGLIGRAPWRDIGSILAVPSVREALQLSLLCSLAAMVASVALGLPLAWALARRRFVGRGVVRALCTVSMVLPPVVGGVALQFALGRRGLVGQWLYRWFGLQIAYTSTAVVIAQTFVAMPFFIVTVEAALRQTESGRREAAQTLGASSWYAFRRVTLPSIRPALIAGAVLSWARAFGEFGATITFAGSSPGRTRTLPSAVYLALDSNQRQAVVLALLMVAVSFAVLVALRDRWMGGGDRA